MSYYKKPLLIIFTSSPGSGKSYFSRQAAKKMNAVRLSSDALRVGMFGSIEATHALEDKLSKIEVLNYLFGAMDYAAEQVLMTGQDVFYDANSNKRIHRSAQEDRAAKYGAIPVVVRLTVPYEVALRRGQEREELPDQRKKTEESMRELIQRIQSNTDEPGADENVIELDGQAPFEKQFAEFERRVGEILEHAQ
jgi:predicted kinase